MLASHGFLESELEAKAASQASLAIKRYSGHSKYSQEVPRQMTGLHLAAYLEYIKQQIPSLDAGRV